MDETVKPALVQAMLAAAFALGAAPVHGQALADPTRPPPMLAPATAGAAAGAAASGPVLQSVLIGRQAGGRQVAVIDGETVPLGGAFHGAVLVRMTETEVELMRGRERQVLKLFAAEPGGRPGRPTKARPQ